MSSIVFYFQVHQPYRLKRYRVFDIGSDHQYFNDDSDRDTNNRKVFRKVADKCYLPANAIWLDLLHRHPELKLTYSLSGVFMEQAEEWGNDVLESFRKLVATGRVEILSETYHHSLSFLYNRNEFLEQVKMHRDMVQRLFGVTPTSFRNTELIYHNDIASFLTDPETQRELGMKFSAILAEGADHVLGWRSPNFLYTPPSGNIALMLKNYKLSDDIAFRFSSRAWKEWPLTAPKFAHWLSQTNGNGNVVNLFMDYETFGEHQWEDTGIFDFLRALPEEVYRHPDNHFLTVTEASRKYAPVGTIDVPHFMSWADVERDLSAWLGNGMQNDAIKKLFDVREEIMKGGNHALIRDWRKLTTSDHFYYMCTKWFSDGDVHKYFSPYESPYDAFIAFSNALQDVLLRLHRLKEHDEVAKELELEVKHEQEQPQQEITAIIEKIEEGIPSPIHIKRNIKVLSVEHESRRVLRRPPRKF